ncbi:MAG: Eco57I restriction-modification methylase domain-containing protein [Candidatus Loosdrechtia sp.]|uniref:Eco57I restriction-modification methylase domain-containing protein n=1 Tax=Candidatus Loosdrechtia sp. TaxID=3101272 RepID=UPI003A61D3C9|nr:MAG: Eco57I restriction-modification methylase domain-containing protein [Candidatus Jettenia sp. AMX2]
MAIKDVVLESVPAINSPEKIYDLFRLLGYPDGKLLDPTYKRKIEEFDFAREEGEKVKDIFTVFNYDSKLQIFLIETKTFSTPLVRYLAKRLSDRYLNFLLILTADYKEYTFIFPEFERIEEGKHKLKLTRLILDRENTYHTDLLTISNLALTGEEENWRDIWRRWRDAFSVEKVTDRFFDEYKKAFFKLRETFKNQGISVKDAHELSQQFLNRLMFLYFISKKRWLNNDLKFIRWYWQRYKEERRYGNVQADSFYEKWLRVLFLEAFNNQYSHPSYHPKDIEAILASAPYLNGGLFRRSDLDDLPFKISDNLFEEIFVFLEQYNFTIREELPLDIEVAVDPQMIGYVYESLSNVAEEIYERQDMGIFYTPTTEVDFMCKRSLVEYLTNHLNLPIPPLQKGGEGGFDLPLPKEWIYRLLFDEDKKEVEAYITKHNLWYRLEEILDNLAVIDPACGSGAFLVGMLHVLVELYRLIYSHIHREMTEFELKKRIIGVALYGVDIMPWAVHSAELRLWLQLIIDADIPPEQRKLHPLLPNLDLKLRVGDSLVQKVEGISLRVKDMEISPSLKRKLLSLKTEKEKYYNNDSTAKFKGPKSLIQEEFRVFTEILDDKVITYRKKIQTLETEKIPVQCSWIDGGAKEEFEQKGLVEEQIKILEQKIEEIKEVKRKIKEPGHKPFVWDIDFAEIFGDKGGFDIVIGNPPYVRQEKIAPPNKLKAEVTLEDKREYKERLFDSVHAHFPCIQKIDKKSDYYIYFYFNGMALLNDKGTFCFITSNSWLDVGYGKDLQEFLLKYCHIKAIYDNQSKRSFEHADVNTIIALFSTPNVGAIHELPLQNTARFVMFKRPFKEVINTKNLLEIENAKDIVKTDAYRVFPVKQEVLLEEGWEYPEDVDAIHELHLQKPKQKTLIKDKFLTGKYEGNKWGGKYLRAPDIFFTILEKGKGKLVRLRDIAEVRFGIKTGCNEYFYLPSKHFDIRKDGKYYELIPKHEGLPEKMRIEEEYLRPAIISPRDLTKIAFQAKDLKNLIFFCNTEGKKKSTGVQQYIKFGEKQKFNFGSTLKARNPWWQIKEHRNSKLIWAMMHARRHNVHFNSDGCEVDHNFFEIIPKVQGSSENLAGQATSTLLIFIKELFGRAYGGGSGPIKNEGVDIVQYLVIAPEAFSCDEQDKFIKSFEIMFAREIKDAFEELGINSAHPIREQKPNPLPDRKALDDVVFDIIGLTQDERNEVYWAVCELVKNRLDKARSV